MSISLMLGLIGMLAITFFMLLLLFRTFVFPLFITLSITLLALPLYYYWGSPKEYTSYIAIKSQQQAIKAMLQHYQNPQQLITKMKEILEHNPLSSQGWYLLGRLYMTQNQFDQAVKSFQRANVLGRNDISLQEQMAVALFYQNHQRLNVQAQIWVDKVFQQQPDNLLMWNIKALDALRRHQPKQAVKAWQHILEQLPPDSQAAKDLLKTIATVQTHETISH